MTKTGKYIKQWDKNRSSRKPRQDSLIHSNTTMPLFHLPPLSRWDCCPLFLRMMFSPAPSSLTYSRHCFHRRLIFPGWQWRLSKCSFPACFSVLALLCIYGFFIMNLISLVSSLSHLQTVFSLWTPATQGGIQTSIYFLAPQSHEPLLTWTHFQSCEHSCQRMYWLATKKGYLDQWSLFFFFGISSPASNFLAFNLMLFLFFFTRFYSHHFWHQMRSVFLPDANQF